MNPFDFLDDLDDLGRLGRRGWGRGGWGKRRHWGGGMGHMGGWVFPALILGRIVQEVFDQQSRQQTGGSSWPQPNVPPIFQSPTQPQSPAGPPPSPWGASEAKPVMKTTKCVNCDQPVSAGYAFCPHCGRSVSKRECAYCSRDIPAGAERCVGCGAPAGYAKRA
jgi:hypothetical protein